VPEAREDEVLDAVEDVVAVLEESRTHASVVDHRAEALRRGRERGASYAELLTEAEGPLILEAVTNLLDGLLEAGGRLRRAQARALYAEGLSMDKVGRLLRVSRQRVSALIAGPVGPSASSDRRRLRRSMGLTLTDPELRMIADSIPQIVWVARPDGATEYLNREGRGSTGLPPQATYGWHWADLVHADDRDRARIAWEEAVRARTPFEIDCRLRRFDGAFRWHRFRGSAFRGLDGRISKWIGTAVDIQEAKALEPVEAMFVVAPLAMVIVDRQYRVVQINERAAAVNGAPPDEQIGRAVAQLVPDLWPQVERAYAKVRDDGVPVVNVGVRGSTAEDPGREHRWLASFTPVLLESGALGVGVTATDITDVELPHSA
jgi:PAS domain S-box-containing protein